MTRKHLADLLTVILAVAAVASALVTVRRELTKAPERRSRVSWEPSWKSFATHGHILGNPAADVTIVEFADYQCPFCQRFTKYVDSLRILGRDVRVIYRHMPGQGHQHAVAAVRASECAAAQIRFVEMHSVLNSYPDSIGVTEWEWFGSAAGVQDLDAFSRCVAERGPIAELAMDTLDARKLRVLGTPTLLIHDQRYDGLPPFDSLLAYVDRTRRKKN